MVHINRAKEEGERKGEQKGEEKGEQKAKEDERRQLEQGIAMALAVLVTLFVCCFGLKECYDRRCWRCRKRRKKKGFMQLEASLLSTHTMRGTVHEMQPLPASNALGSIDELGASFNSDGSSSVEDSEQDIIKNCTMAFEELTIGDKIGVGASGVVMRGMWRGTPCAVRPGPGPVPTHYSQPIQVSRAQSLCAEQ